MEKTKLIRIIKTLNTREFKRFRLFVQSPLYNTNQRHILLLDYIAKFYPKFSASSFSEEKAYAKVFPKSSFKNGAITKVASKLFILLVDFLSTEKTLNNLSDKDFNLLQEYSQRNLNHDFDRLSKKMLSYYEKNTTALTNNHYYQKYLLEKEINIISSTQEDQGSGDAHFINTGKALDIYYYYTKLINTCQVINRAATTKGIEVNPIDIKIVEIIPETEYINEPVIKIWYSAYSLMTKDDKLKYYRELKEHLFTSHEIFTKSELRALFTFLENFLAVTIKPQKAMFEEIYKVYNFQMEKDILLHDEMLIPGILKNYMIVSLNLEKIEEAGLFLEKTKAKVTKIYPDNHKFCTAMYFFAKAEYDTTLSSKSI